MAYDYAGKTWADFGPKNQPNPWVTQRALRVLKAVAAAEWGSARRQQTRRLLTAARQRKRRQGKYEGKRQ